MSKAFPSDSNVPNAPQGRRGWQFFGVALGAFLAVAVAPATGWLVREQLAIVSQTRPLSDEAVTACRIRAARRVPHDAGARVAEAQLTARDGTIKYGNPRYFQAISEALLDVHNRFPSDPLPIAAMLRNSANMLTIDRPESQMLYGYSPVKHEIPVVTMKQQQIIQAQCEQMAEVGERLDPNNAFFPAMHAMVAFSQNKDALGIADIDRAAVCSLWNDYVAEELVGTERLDDRAFGPRSRYEKVMVALDHVCAHYQEMRNLGDQLTWQAVLQEREGKVAEGIALRGRAIRLGALIRDSKQNVESLQTGRTIMRQAMIGAGGNIPGPKSTRQSTITAALDHVEGKYIAYLQNHGFAAEASWIAAQSLRNASLPDFRNSTMRVITPKLACLWIGELSLLSSVWLLAIIAAILAVVRYRKRFDIHPLRITPRAIRAGILLGIFAAISLLVPVLTNVMQIYGSGMWILYTLLVLALASRAGAKRLQPFLRTAVITVALIDGFLWLLSKQSTAIAAFMLRSEDLLSIPSPNPWLGLPFVLALVLPGAIAAATFARCRRRQIPLISGFREGMARLALPALSVTLCLYSGSVLATLPDEMAGESVVRQLITNDVSLLVPTTSQWFERQ